MYPELKENEVLEIRARNGQTNPVQGSVYYGQRVRVIVECPDCSADGEVQEEKCPNEPEDGIPIWFGVKTTCSKCGRELKADIQLYRVSEVENIELDEEEIERDDIAYKEAVRAWRERTSWRKALDYMFGRRFVFHSRTWIERNVFNIAGLNGLYIAVAIKCKDGCCGRSSRILLHCQSEGLFKETGVCNLCGKEIETIIRFIRE